MNETPEKLARQRASAQMTECKCGNVAKLGQELCGRCESEASPPDFSFTILGQLESRVDQIAIDEGRDRGIESKQVQAVVRLIAEIVQLNGLKIPG